VRKQRPDTITLLGARAMLHFARDWHLGHLVPAPAATLYSRFLYAYSPRLAHRYSRKRSPGYRRLIATLEFLTLPGIMLHYAVRKQAVERLVRSRLALGAQQVVVLGAGFDTLAVRLHREFPGVRFIEVDRASLLALKRRALTGQWSPLANLCFIDADPAHEPLEKNLLESAYISGTPTVFIIEGLLAFMDVEQRDRLFEFVNVLSGPGSSAVFTFMEREPTGRIHFRGATWLARAWWRLRGARFRWGPSRDELEEYLARRGFALKTVLTAGELRVQFLDGDRDVPLAEGEDVAIAEVVLPEEP